MCLYCSQEGAKRKCCPRCGRCLYHEGCLCQECTRCSKKVAPPDICTKCQACFTHHLIVYPKGYTFPLRRCTYKQTCTAVAACASPLCEYCGACKAHAKCACATFSLNPLRRSLGVEIELATTGGLDRAIASTGRIAQVTKHITYHFEHDGSVQPSGQELVTGRMLGDAYLLGMTELAAALTRKHCTVNATCGIHVHVDAASASAVELRRLYVAFASIQNDLFGTLVKRSRLDPSPNGHHYCAPLPLKKAQLVALLNKTKNSEVMDWFHHYLYGAVRKDTGSLEQRRALRAAYLAQLEARKGHKYENAARRQALNFHSWMMRGTVEFRLKEGTLDPQDLVMWPLWCGWFVEKVFECRDGEIVSWIENPPSILELSESFATRRPFGMGGGSTPMPQEVLQWVRKKCAVAEPPRAPKLKKLYREDIFGNRAIEEDIF